MAITSTWVGGVTPGGARVIAVTGAASARLAVSTSPALTSPTYFGPVTPTAYGVVDFTATGLAASRKYYYAIEEAGTLDTATTGSFITAPATGSAASFRFASSSCALGVTSPWSPLGRVSNAEVFDTIRGQAPAFFVHSGDLHYRDIGTNEPDRFRQAYSDVLSAPRQHELYRSIATVYVWDDHDFGPDNSDGTAPGRPAASSVFRERVPSYPLPDAGGAVYHSFTYGRVLFVVSDTRHDRSPDGVPDGPSKSMLGSAQKTWMRNVLEASTAEALVWVNPTPWLGLSSDTWAGFAHERDEITDMLTQTGWVDRMICVSGDYHGLCMDTGGNNRWGGFPVYIFGSLDSVTEGNGTPATQYDMGPASIGPDRYGVVDVQDDGNFLTLTSTGYVGQTPWRSHSLTIQTAAAGAVPPRALSLTYDEQLSRVRVTSAELDSPDNYHPFADAFARTVSNGWGTADVGGVWSTSGGATGDYLTTSGVGRVAHTDVGTRRFTQLGGSWVDVEFVGQVTAPVVAAGAAIQAGYTVRMQDPNNWYCALLNFGVDGLVHADIQKRTAGTITTLASTGDQPYSAGFRKWVRVRVVGSALSVKVWADGDPEPLVWGATASDADQKAGSVGTHSAVLTGNTNTLPVNLHFDNLTSNPPPPVTIDVERSTNGVVWDPIRGGAGHQVRPGDDLTVDDYEFAADTANDYRVTVRNADGKVVDVQTATTTPQLGGVWLKSITRPFLNRRIDLAGEEPEFTRPSRAGVFAVVGRSVPVVVNDVRAAQQYSIVARTADAAERDDLDFLLASGDALFLHAPGNHCVLTSAYVTVGDSSRRRLAPGSAACLFTLPLTECAAPAASVVGATITWAGIVASYDTWADVMAANAGWRDVLELVGRSSDVIVD